MFVFKEKSATSQWLGCKVKSISYSFIKCSSASIYSSLKWTDLCHAICEREQPNIWKLVLGWWI